MEGEASRLDEQTALGRALAWLEALQLPELGRPRDRLALARAGLRCVLTHDHHVLGLLVEVGSQVLGLLSAAQILRLGLRREPVGVEHSLGAGPHLGVALGERLGLVLGVCRQQRHV